MSVDSRMGDVAGSAGDALLSLGGLLRRAQVSADKRALFQIGGRDADTFYRDRWSYDKVVRSTHGVNCTGSCSWKVYVKDGIITWESQQTDYPSVGPDRPEYEPRGCPRGAAFSWYTYSPTRVRYPYARGVLVEMYREAKARLVDPVAAWAEIQADPERRRRYQRGRGKGGLVRVSWDEALEIVAAAHVHAIKEYGPDRVAGFSPIPAMSMVSHAVGARFISLIGGSMLSFYDWYADLPVASPQVFGDQTDVPESADWWDAAYLIMWGSNVPVTRTPDAHWMAEARYRGQKVIVVAPDYADNVKFADEWLPAQPGTDGALAMAMGHVVLKEFFVDHTTPHFVEYVRRYTDLPFLVTVEPVGDGTYRPGKFLTAADLGSAEENATAKPVVWDDAAGAPAVPNGSVGFRWGEAGAGRWNLDLAGIEPALGYPTDEESAEVALPRFDTATAGVLRRGVPVRRVHGHLTTTVYDLMLAQYGVARPGLPGQWPADYDDHDVPYTPAWQEPITGVPAQACARIAREFAAQLQAFGVQEVTLHSLIRPERLTAEQVALGRYALPTGSKTTNWLRETGGIAGELYGLEADAFPPEAIRATFAAAATPYLRAFRPLAGLGALLEEAARRRLDALPLAAVVAQFAALGPAALLALTRHLRPRLVPGDESPAPAVAERIVQMDAAELRELGRRLRERRAPAAAEG